MSGLTAKGVPPFPPWLRFVKFAILGLNLVVLALSAYAVSIVSGGTGSYLIFVTIKTFIIMGGSLAIELAAPQLYYRIFILIAYVLNIIFWLSAWSWSASSAAFWLAYDSYYTHLYAGEGGALAGCAALGAFIWVLSIVNLIFFIKSCRAGSSTANQAELGQAKYGQPTAPPTAPPPGAAGASGYYQNPYAQPAQYPAQPYNVQPYQPQQTYTQ